ncbi:MAG TPA: hypothetical protein VGS97_25850 [Actinocrinis sp.]|uniref:hypothetical protein n=1 Tax=Actinocrinis sp. TaxID=1920516 RepID=UPI002DDCD3AF|nr:hypothetical protein [Actinocrinis sp.]HEV2347542.1 hypothetical protein [Actinocrinis sp.]
MYISKFTTTLTAAALAAAGVVAVAGPAAADYGSSAVRQIELSANVPGPQGGGAWLWIELSGDHTGDYHGADCGHGGGAVSDKGTVWWETNGADIVIHNVILNGLGGFDATVTVPWATGHYTGTVGTFITLPSFIPPFVGTSQLQVAP